MGIMFIINSILLGAGLAMDAFSVSCANGLHEPNMKASKMGAVAGTFGAFQFAMPMIGWICVHTIVTIFKAFQKFIPWIALLLLLYIGGKMVIEAIKKEEADEVSGVTFGALIIQGIATSIDALSVGFTISDYDTAMALISSLIIGITTFIICVLGLVIGKKFGNKFSSTATLIGGLILIFIGIEIFVKGVF